MSTALVSTGVQFPDGSVQTSAASGGGPSLGTDSIIRTNSTSINENITIPAGTNGITAGPVSVANGYTVNVIGTWTII